MVYTLLTSAAKTSTRRRICPATGAVLVLFIVYLCYVGENADRTVDYQPEVLHLTTRYSLQQMQEFARKSVIINHYNASLYYRWNLSFNKIINHPVNKFNINANDVIVFLHVQKTAGTTFEKFLVKHLNISRPCICQMDKKRCKCYRPHSRKEFWLFSRYSTGWACGLHADFTELFVSGCVEHALDKQEGKHRERRYFYTTFLREPVERFISEYSHVTRGANWLGARHFCNGQLPTPEQLPMCFNPEVGWKGLELNEFLACPFNLAFNRQTRMLANLSLVNCYNSSSMDPSTRDAILLKSAKDNLRNMAFFGLKERMNESQFIFENLFSMNFTESLGVWNRSKSQHIRLTKSQLLIIRERNALDILLYQFAIRLFEKRLKIMTAGRQTSASPSLHVRTNSSIVDNDTVISAHSLTAKNFTLSGTSS